jgi:hypothetical protein
MHLSVRLPKNALRSAGRIRVFCYSVAQETTSLPDVVACLEKRLLRFAL